VIMLKSKIYPSACEMCLKEYNEIKHMLAFMLSLFVLMIQNLCADALCCAFNRRPTSCGEKFQCF
jgi:hypothetical protein